MNSLLFKTAVDYFLRRLGEPSTWAGIGIWIAGHQHFQYPKDFQTAFVTFGLGLSGLLAVLFREAGK